MDPLLSQQERRGTTGTPGAPITIGASAVPIYRAASATRAWFPDVGALILNSNAPSPVSPLSFCQDTAVISSPPIQPRSNAVSAFDLPFNEIFNPRTDFDSSLPIHPFPTPILNDFTRSDFTRSDVIVAKKSAVCDLPFASPLTTPRFATPSMSNFTVTNSAVFDLPIASLPIPPRFATPSSYDVIVAKKSAVFDLPIALPLTTPLFATPSTSLFTVANTALFALPIASLPFPPRFSTASSSAFTVARKSAAFNSPVYYSLPAPQPASITDLPDAGATPRLDSLTAARQTARCSMPDVYSPPFSNHPSIADVSPPLARPPHTQLVSPPANNANILSTAIPTPIKVDRLEKELGEHPNRAFVNKLCTELREGAHIGYNGPRHDRRAKNLASAFINPQKVTDNFQTEVSLGRTAGPFDKPPLPNLQVSPIGLVPKKHSNKFRTIFHLSYPKGGDSINSFINKDDFSLTYVTIDKAIKHIQLLGPAMVYLAKTDIESAFRLFPVHPADWELLGMQWKGQYYYDKVLPFGLRSAPFLFNQLSDALEWVLIQKCAISFVCHFLDDFLIMEPQPSNSGPNNCQTSLTSMLLAFQQLGVPLSKDKTVGPSTELEFLGIILDSGKAEARLPPDKLSRLNEELKTWSTRKKATLVQLQSLIGTLNFACKVIPPGRAFLQRIIELTIGLTKPYHQVKLKADFFKDIAMWTCFLESWNGKAFFLNNYWESSVELHLFTDASGSLGYGGIFRTQWFQGTWQPHQTLVSPGLSIAWQELYAIVVACAIWGAQWVRKRVIFHCDNISVVHIINSKRSPCKQIMNLVRQFTLINMQHNFHCRAQHVPGVSNAIADSLSRFQNQRFRQLAPWANQLPEEIPSSFLQS